eukprot:164927-Amorphochlora_amoeboformis.AAC.1
MTVINSGESNLVLLNLRSYFLSGVGLSERWKDFRDTGVLPHGTVKRGDVLSTLHITFRMTFQ